MCGRLCTGVRGGMANGKRQKVGSIGNIGCFSFFPSKNLGGFGDAGMISSNDDEIANLVRALIKHGGKDKYNVDHIGYNARLDTLQAAILIAKLKYIDEFNTRRRHIAQRYTEGLKDVPGIVLPLGEVDSSLALSPLPLAQGSSVVHQFTLRVLNGERDFLRQYLRDLNIDSMVYYPVPLHEMKVFDGKYAVCDGIEEAEKTTKEVLSLPIEPHMNDEGVSIVVKGIISSRVGAHPQP
jgi:dTDP-4-amino-4,6-dideoxygalactose transaminase